VKELVTCLELSERLYPIPHDAVAQLIDEGDQIARMTDALMRRLSTEN